MRVGRSPSEEAFLYEVGEMIESERIKRGWSVREAAERAGVSWWGWRNTEVGTSASLVTIYRLADALNLDVFIDLEPR